MAKKRNRPEPSNVPLPKAGPNGSFPIGDKVHDRMAISGATRSANAGNITPAEEARIKARARADLKAKGGLKGGAGKVVKPHHATGYSETTSDRTTGLEKTMGKMADKMHK